MLYIFYQPIGLNVTMATCEVHEVTNGEIPQYIELLTTKFYPRSILVSNRESVFQFNLKK